VNQPNNQSEAAPRLEDHAGQGKRTPESLSNQPGATSPQPDYRQSQDFLRRFRPEGPWVLTAIGLDRKGIETRTFTGADESSMRSWLEAQGESRNIYFHVNPTLRPLSKKASEEDVRGMAWLHVDIDPRVGEDIDEEQERALRLLREPPGDLPPPTCIVFSGGGYQGFWKLREEFPIQGQKEAYEEAKRYNMQLELLFSADHCHNVDRIMRLPGTVNRPDKKKRAKGRKEVLAELIEWHEDRVYELESFKQSPAADAPAPQAVSVNAEAVERLADVNDPRLDRVSDLAKVVIVQGRDPEAPERFAKPGTTDLDRSAALYHVCCELVRSGVDDQTIYAVITDPGFRISESVLELGNRSNAYALRQIERARAAVADFDVDKNGRPYATPANVRLALDKLGVQLEYDSFADRSHVSGLSDFGPVINDAALTRLWLLIEEQYQLCVGKDRFWSIASDLARRSPRHPVCEYLDEQEWDGTHRLDRWLVEYMGAEDTAYVRAVGAIVLVAAVRRVRQPGCKFDEMLVLEGPQGRGKSTALSILAGHEDWFSDDLPLGADTKRFIEATAGRWIVEAGELKGMRKSEVEAIKSLLSRRVDRARLAYGRTTTEIPRQFVIVGTTNSERYLRDNTGNRRFWPVRTRDIDLKGIRRDRDQLWAEAAQREAQGAAIRLDPALYEEAAGAQEDRRVVDPFLERLAEALGEIQGQLRAEDAWKIVGVQAGQRQQEHNTRLGDAMRELGWRREKKRFGGPPAWAYTCGDGPKLTVTGEFGGDLCVHPEGELP